MGPAGFAAVALWIAGAAPELEMDARIETRTHASGAVARTPVDQPVLEASPSVALRVISPRTRFSAAYEPYLVLANPGSSNDSGVLHRLALSGERALSPNWTGGVRVAGAAGTTVATRPILNEPLEVAPNARVLRRAQAEVAALVAGRPAPRMTVTTDAALLWGGGLDASSRADAPSLREARIATSLAWEATRRDRMNVEVTAGGSNAATGRRSIVATTMGGLSRRLTPNADAWASVGLGIQRTDAPTEAATFRVGPAASAGTALRLLQDRLQGQASLRAAPQLSTWDGTAAWRIDVSTAARAVLSRRWQASALASGVRVVNPDGRETDVAELLVQASYSPVGRVAVSAGMWTRSQHGAGSPDIVETGALVAFSVTGVPLAGVPVALPR